MTPRHKHRNCHENSRRESCEFLDRTILHRISVRTTFQRRHFPGEGQLLGPETGFRDINKEIVTKIVAVRAVDLSIGPFCTEFRCERFRDDAVFRKIENLAGSCRFGSAGSAVRAGSVRAGSRFVSVRGGSVRAGSVPAVRVRFVATLTNKKINVD